MFHRGGELTKRIPRAKELRRRNLLRDWRITELVGRRDPPEMHSQVVRASRERFRRFPSLRVGFYAFSPRASARSCSCFSRAASISYLSLSGWSGFKGDMLRNHWILAGRYFKRKSTSSSVL